MVHNPQNPYLSFIVPASAGSGKTYQLSRRFLSLVAAHGAPGQILTVTFTKKAAGEMRSRILSAAAQLIADPKEQERFDADMRAFHRSSGQGTAPPLPAQVVGRTILASSQLLKISTIDSLFLEWVSKFPFEADAPLVDGSGGAEDHMPFPSPFRLADKVDSRGFTDMAWRTICQLLSRGVTKEGTQHNEAVAALLDAFADLDLERLSRRLKALEYGDTFLWHAEQKNGDGTGYLPIPLGEELDRLRSASDREIVSHLARDLAAIAQKLSNASKKDAVLAAIQAQSLEGLLASGLITKTTGQISGSVIRGKNRELVEGHIAAVDEVLVRYQDAKKIHLLNREGEAYYGLYKAYSRSRDVLKYQENRLEFSDLAKGAFRLFHGDAGAGVRFLLSRTIQHVLLDEFQDTSRLQWSIFSEMAMTLLAGLGADDRPGARPSVFIVGDTKQSIYGFREADPAVMGEARESLRDYLEEYPISASYRTSQVVLDFVNMVFQRGEKIPEFPHHVTATHNQQPVVPNIGRVMVGPLFAKPEKAKKSPKGSSDDDQGSPSSIGPGEEDSEEQKAAEREAEYVAETLSKVLAGEMPCPVPTKQYSADGNPILRPIRPGDCAILYRSTTNAALYEKALRRHGIPCQREEERGFFNRPEVADMVALLTFLEAPSDTLALATVLRSPLVRLSDQTLLKLLQESLEGMRSTSLNTPDDGKNGNEDAPRYKTILDGMARVDPHHAAILMDLVSKTDKILPHALLTEALTRLDALTKWQRVFHDQPGEAAVASANLLRLIEISLTLESAGHTTLGGVLKRLSILADDDEVGNASAAPNTVTLMTIHKSKGLEFPLVAVVDTGRPFGQQDPFWTQQDDLRRNLSGMTYIGNREEQPREAPAFKRLSEEAVQKIKDESLRLLYVALTRAKHYVLITGHEGDGKKGLAETVPYPLLRDAISTLPEDAKDRGTTLDDSRSMDIIGWNVGVQGTIESFGYGELSLEHQSTEIASIVDHFHDTKTRSSSDDLPSQWRVRSPSRHDDDRSDNGESRVDDKSTHELDVKPWPVPELATHLGTLIHQGLDAFLRGKAFDGVKAWQTLAPLRYRDRRYTEEALEQLAFAITDPRWQVLLTTASKVETELPIVSRPQQGSSLVIGNLDALIHLGDGRLLLIDHKTTRFSQDPSTVTDAQLRAFAWSRRWQEQLADYAAALRGIYPDREIVRAIYFTSLRRLVVCDGRDIHTEWHL